MRLASLLLSAAATTTSALQLDYQPFLSALALPLSLQDYITSTNGTATNTSPAHDILRRQSSDSCPSNFVNCASLGASSLCCDSNAVCSADYAGHVACCPSGAACSGTIGGVITAGTLSNGVLISGGVAASTTTTNGLLVGGAATTTTTQGFVAATTTTGTGGNGLVAATTTVGESSNSGFILDGTSTVATPGAAARALQMPLVARGIVKVLEYLPI